MLDLIFSLLDQIADTDENYTMANATTFVLFTMPTSIYELLPFAALGGALIGLGCSHRITSWLLCSLRGKSFAHCICRIEANIFYHGFELLLGE
ncbi:MAG: hypothetical protein Ct9H300mP22_7140 [Gammaproteobacteria bacterium]|nr:MAG: hypothetical protein Ct9H300mP22_7140 [Gammaproteobacteria bacterium]